jgi:2,4-dichlorophenol 6-monooxygenase
MGPTWDRHSEEWNFHFMFRPDDPARHDEAAIVPRIKDLLGIPDVEFQTHAMSHWTIDRIVADKYRVGPFLFVGDAVHRQPPTTALGLNTGIQDVHNLCWKLAAVLRGEASDALLDTYESERRPIGIFNADWGIFAFHHHFVTDAAIGLRPGLTPEEKYEAMTTFFSDTPIGRLTRARFDMAWQTSKLDFQAHDVDLGFFYEQGALVSDGTPAPDRDPLGGIHVPTSRPGHRLPHAWLASGDGRVSTHDLVIPGHFAILTGPEGSAWTEAAAEVAKELNLTIDAYLIGAADLSPADDRWAAVRGIEDDGVLLVRPDQHVGWRSESIVENPGIALRETLVSILGAGVPASAHADAGAS